MNLAEHYNTLYETSSREILAGNYQLDHRINDHTDQRFGITLRILPGNAIKEKMQAFLEELKAIDPRQYYYPGTDLHITVMSIISCYNGFNLQQISVPAYVEMIHKSLAGIHKFDIQFKGITASPAAVMVQGFPVYNNLNLLRDQLRNNFRNSGLEESMDMRYAIATAHVTVVRFQEPLIEKEQLIRLLEKYRHHDFGTMQVESIELVYNDWYQRKKLVQSLHNFTL